MEGERKNTGEFDVFNVCFLVTLLIIRLLVAGLVTVQSCHMIRTTGHMIRITGHMIHNNRSHDQNNRSHDTSHTSQVGCTLIEVVDLYTF